METVNEGSTSYFQVDFKDKDGNPAIPTQVDYKVHDEASGTVIRNNGTVPPAASVVITLDATDNTILNTAGKHEIRVVTVIGTYGVNDKLNKEFRYELVNLHLVP